MFLFVLFFFTHKIEFYIMDKDFYTLSEALKIMNLRDSNNKILAFDISYRTFNEQTKQGGKLKVFKDVKYLPEAKASIVDEEVYSDKHIKAPNHYDNRTRNIELSTGEIRKIRIDFIISINNKKVIL